MKHCLICGCKTTQPIAALMEHLRPLTLEHKMFWRGTYQTLGLRAALTLASPLLNTILTWKYRKHRLTAQFNALDDVPNAAMAKEKA